MKSVSKVWQASAFALVFAAGLALAGCDDNVEVIRDPDVHITKGMTWAWRPITPPGAARKDSGDRPVVSRDVINPPQPQQQPQQRLESNRDWNTEANRDILQQAIERAMKSKGLLQLNDPATADFLVDYHVKVRTQNATVQRVYGGGYPGVVCGPWGCWSSWGWGPPEVEYQNVQYHEGTFVFDLALRNPRKLAYRAIGQKELPKRTISPYQADQAIGKLLKALKVQ